MFKFIVFSGLLALGTASPASSPPPPPPTPPGPPGVPAAVFSTTCNGKPYTYKELAGFGFVPGNALDKYGDSISLGSSIAISSWKKKDSKYEGTLWGLPDRGWNTEGTINYQPRVHQFTITLSLAPKATIAKPSAPNLAFKYKNTILLAGPDGKATTALDADRSGGLQYPGFPLLPAATWTGDGFGGSGPGGKAVTIDAESLVLSEDGGFWISDEYGPGIYKFDKNGKMTASIVPPDALLPLRNGSVRCVAHIYLRSFMLTFFSSFPSNNAPRFDPSRTVVPANPTQGRQNNQGFEGMTMSPDGIYLWILLQSAARQEGGSSPNTRIHARLLQYTIKNSKGTAQRPVYKAEYVVPLPTFTDATGKLLIAAQSELHFISDTQFFFLPRDSAAGRGFASSTSLYRHVDVFDISKATNVKGSTYDAFNASVASTGMSSTCSC